MLSKCTKTNNVKALVVYSRKEIFIALTTDMIGIFAYYFKHRQKKSVYSIPLMFIEPTLYLNCTDVFHVERIKG